MTKYLVIDVDGTLTDGTVYIGNHGELCKGFFVRDGLGIQQLISSNVEPIILTSRESRIVVERCKELGIKQIYQGVKDKKKMLEKIMKDNNIKKEELAYIADDINDIFAIELASIKACPADAVSEMKNICNYISIYKGGQGAVREICDYIINNNKQRS